MSSKLVSGGWAGRFHISLALVPPPTASLSPLFPLSFLLYLFFFIPVFFFLKGDRAQSLGCCEEVQPLKHILSPPFFSPCVKWQILSEAKPKLSVESQCDQCGTGADDRAGEVLAVK